MSWRDSSDPRCPDCGEKLASTAVYCMHCETDLDGDSDTTEDSVLADDEHGGVGSEDWRGTTPIGRDEPSDATGTDSGESSHDTDSGRSPGRPVAGARHRAEGVAHSLTSVLWTDVPEPEGVPNSEFAAPLWMRAPVGFVAGLVVYAVFVLYVVVLLDPLPGSITGALGVVGFFAIMAWLIRKPLPSDILGDAAYGLAGMLYSVPVVYVAVTAVRSVVGRTGLGLGDVLVTGLVISFGTWVPATVLLVVGYAGNRYARSKLDRIADKAAGDSTR